MLRYQIIKQMKDKSGYHLLLYLTNDADANVVGSGISGQGNSGGTGIRSDSSSNPGGGGGGATSSGGNAALSPSVAGNGGNGKTFNGIFYSGDASPEHQGDPEL